MMDNEKLDKYFSNMREILEKQRELKNKLTRVILIMIGMLIAMVSLVFYATPIINNFFYHNITMIISAIIGMFLMLTGIIKTS